MMATAIDRWTPLEKRQFYEIHSIWFFPWYASVLFWLIPRVPERELNREELVNSISFSFNNP
jgi:hypothetical protein